MAKQSTFWLDPLPHLNVRIGFVPSAAAWKAQMVEFGQDPIPPYLETDGKCAAMDSSDGDLIVLIALSDAMDERSSEDPIGVAGLLVHESVHAWQAICRHIGENDPSSEMEAYHIQFIAQGMMNAFRETRIN